ncbi:MAG: DUF4129 domain-containing protein [Bacteroidia bacterium]|nr:DUF4129 domain-containing protein [Bacteroidia bacterium]
MQRRLSIFGFSFLLFLLSGINTSSGIPPRDENDVRSFDEKKLKEYREDRDFAYGKEPLPEEDEFNFPEPKADLAAILQILMYSLIALVIGLLVYLVIRQSISRKTRYIQTDILPGLETRDIREVIFEDLIRDALANHDYRVAVRLLYLETLKKLTLKEWINWKPFKTNQEYQQELQQTPVKEQFDRLTQSYEYIWYGNFPVSQEGYEYVERVFRHFQSLLEAKK